MTLPIFTVPHPTLRRHSRPVVTVDAKIALVLSQPAAAQETLNQL